MRAQHALPPGRPSRHLLQDNIKSAIKGRRRRDDRRAHKGLL